MNRKNFLGSIIPLGIGAFGSKGNDPFELVSKEEKHTIIPPYLKAGDLIGITCPAGYISLEDVQPAVLKMQEWGFKAVIGDTVGKRDFSFAGTDQERYADLQRMLDDNSIKAIMCARGGYGLVRIIDKIDFTAFVQEPKWIIGFSDITVLHSQLNRQYNIASIHSKMCNSFPADWNAAEPIQKDAIESIRQCLSGQTMEYRVAANPNNKVGMATGTLVGGNLKTLETLSGTDSDIITNNKILFVEDTGEYLYSIDRMFWNLERTGKLAKLKGLIVGGFKTKPDDEGEPFGKTLEAIVLEKLKDHDYPVCFDFPVGHQKNNFALKCGAIHSLIIDESGALLKNN